MDGIIKKEDLKKILGNKNIKKVTLICSAYAGGINFPVEPSKIKKYDITQMENGSSILFIEDDVGTIHLPIEAIACVITTNNFRENSDEDADPEEYLVSDIIRENRGKNRDLLVHFKVAGSVRIWLDGIKKVKRHRSFVDIVIIESEDGVYYFSSKEPLYYGVEPSKISHRS